MRKLAPTLRYEGLLLAEMAGTIGTFAEVPADVLLLGGSKGLPFLKPALDALAQTLPHNRRVQFPGLDHGGSSDASSTNPAAASPRSSPRRSAPSSPSSSCQPAHVRAPAARGAGASMTRRAMGETMRTQLTAVLSLPGPVSVTWREPPTGRCVAPGQVADALLVAGPGVELLAELKVIAVEDDRLQHLIAGAVQRRRGRGRRGRRADSGLAEEAGGVGVEGIRPGGGDRARQPIVELREVIGRTAQG